MCDCGGAGPEAVTDWASGDVVCMRCGVVVEAHILDESPEWRYHDDAGTTSGCRVGQAKATMSTTTTRGSSTYIDVHAGARGTKRRRVGGGEPREVALFDGLRLIDHYVAEFRLSPTSGIAATARELFEHAHEARASRSDTRHATAAAALYLACKLEGTGREVRHVADVCGIPPRALNAATADLKHLLRGRPYHARLHSTLEAGTLLDIFLDRLRLDPAIRKRVWRAAQALDGRVSRLMDCGRKPRTICSGLLWVAVQDEAVGLSKKDVTAACDVCQQTLDKVVAQIRASLQGTV